MAAGTYYTQAEYEQRFGQDELLKLTDADQDGNVDVAIVTEAIDDASADMDAYLSRRYALPIATPHPRLLKSIAAALVREKLHGTFPTDTVTAEADRARKLLRDLASGAATLTIDDTGEETAGGSPRPSGIRISAPGRTFTHEKLDRF